MANLFANLPMPVLNGPGAAVDVSGMGSPKTIIVTGNFQGATIGVEVSEDGGTVFAPLVSFQTGDHTVVLPVAAQFMRVNVSGRKTTVPFAATADVSASDIGALFAAIGMPALNGPGVAVNVSALGVLTTLVSGGVFQGATITVEGSDDGAAYAPVVQFAGQGGMATLEITANFIRANVSGRKTTVPFTGSLAIGAVNDPVGVAGIDVEDEGIALANNPHTTLNFLGAGVTAVDAGGGVANITIAGGIAGLVIDEGAPLAGAPHTTVNYVGAGVTATNAGGGVATVTIPGDGLGQRFSYTVTGVEPDLSELTIPLPAARANALYQVTPSQGTATFGLHMNVANASRTINQFVLSLSGNATAGDVFWFTVADPS